MAYALAGKDAHLNKVVLCDGTLAKPLDKWLSQEFGSLQRRHTVAELLEQATIGVPVAPVIVAPAGLSVAECDARLAGHRAVLEAGADPTAVAEWIGRTAGSATDH